MIFPTMLAPHRTTNRGQPSIHFPIGDHVNVFWCRSHTNTSGVIATSHIVASHITKLLLSFRQILQFRFPQGRVPRIKWLKQSHFCRCAMAILPPPKRPLCFLHCISVTAVKCTIVPVQRSNFKAAKNPERWYRPKITGILFVCN